MNEGQRVDQWPLEAKWGAMRWQASDLVWANVQAEILEQTEIWHFILLPCCGRQTGPTPRACLDAQIPSIVLLCHPLGIVVQVSPCSSPRQGGERRRRQASFSYSWHQKMPVAFPLHPIGHSLVTWPCLAAKAAEKCGLLWAPCAQTKIWGVLLLKKKGTMNNGDSRHFLP